MLLANFHYNSDDLQRSQPLVAPSMLNRLAGGAFGSTFRQTRLGLAVNGPSFAGGKTSGEIELDFYGGTVGQVEGRAGRPEDPDCSDDGLGKVDIDRAGSASDLARRLRQ